MHHGFLPNDDLARHAAPVQVWAEALGMLVAGQARACARTAYARANMRAILAAYSKDELCRLMGYGFGGFFAINRDIALPCYVLLLVGAHDHTGKVRAYIKIGGKRYYSDWSNEVSRDL